MRFSCASCHACNTERIALRSLTQSIAGDWPIVGAMDTAEPSRDDAMLAIATKILAASRSIAVVGLSSNPDKAAHSVPAAMQAHGFHIIPVNPHAHEILGQRSYPRLEAVPEPVDLVDVFRPAPEAPSIARQAVAIGANALWLQQGITSPQAREIAEDADLGYVEDLCIGVARTLSGLTGGGN